MDDNDAKTIVAEFQGFCLARRERSNAQKWHLESVLPQSPRCIAAAILQRQFRFGCKPWCRFRQAHVDDEGAARANVAGQ